jgi:hypothetical protein
MKTEAEIREQLGLWEAVVVCCRKAGMTEKQYYLPSFVVGLLKGILEG